MSPPNPARVYRYVSDDLTLRIASVDCTQVVQQMQTLQNSGPLASIGLGRSMAAAILMASQLKDGQEVGLLVKGNGPLASIYAEATFDGQVRGYCPNPQYVAPQPEDALNLGKAVGNGTLSVVRHQPFQRQPYQGMVTLVTGEVGDDVAHYLHQSQQIRSVVNLGVYVDSFGRVKSAGGLMIEVMPGVEQAIVDTLQVNASNVRTPLSKLLMDGATPKDLLAGYLLGIPFTEIPHEYVLKYHCPCTLDRVKRALTALGMDGLEEMIQDNRQEQVTCQVCGKQYQLEVPDIVALREELRKNSMH